MRKRGCCGFPKKLPFGAKQRKGHVKWHLQPVLITTRSHQALSVVWRHHVALRRLWTRQLSQRPPKKAAQRHHRAPEQPRTPLTQPPARQRGAGSRLWPGAALLHALELVRRRAAPHAIAAAPHQANPSAAAHRWRPATADSHVDSVDRRQIASTARACGPASPSSADSGLDTSSKHKANYERYLYGAKRRGAL